jgi:hypothetical protein
VSLNRYRNNTTKSVAVQLLEVSSGNLLHSSDSIAKCAKFLEVSYPTAHNRINSGSIFLFKGKLVYICKVEK